jgi:prepilin-type N-terminal cleavage/methylation domain-containing protein
MICRAPLRRSIHSNNSNSGFTLLEVLVSLTIMALIVGVAFAGFSIGIDSWRRGTKRIEDLDRRFSVERLLQRQIAMADSQMFEGDTQQLQFTTTYSLANGPGDPVWVKYQLDVDGLTYSEVPLAEYLLGQSLHTVNQTFTGFSSMGFQYLYAAPGGQLEWFYASTKDSPVAVRIDIGDEALNIRLVNKQ